MFGYQEQEDTSEKQRTCSTSVNRVEIIDPELSSTLHFLPIQEDPCLTMV